MPDRVRARCIASVCGAEGFGLHETDCGEQELLVQVYRKKEKKKTPHLKTNFSDPQEEGRFIKKRGVNLQHSHVQ